MHILIPLYPIARLSILFFLLLPPVGLDPGIIRTMDSLGAAVNGVAEVLAPDDPFQGPSKSIAPWSFKLFSAWMLLVTFVSLGENFLVMMVTHKFKQLRQPLNYLIVNLSVADFLMSLIGGTISVMTNYHGYFYLGRWTCVLEGFAVTFFGK